MAQQTIKFTIRQDGTVTEEVMGVVGNDCENPVSYTHLRAHET